MIGRTLALFSALTLGAWPIALLVPLAAAWAVAYVLLSALHFNRS